MFDDYAYEWEEYDPTTVELDEDYEPEYREVKPHYDGEFYIIDLLNSDYVYS